MNPNPNSEFHPLKKILRGSVSLSPFEMPEFRVEGRTRPESPSEKMQRQIDQLRQELESAQKKLHEQEEFFKRKIAEERSKAIAEGESKGVSLGKAQAHAEFESRYKKLQSEVAATLKTINEAYGKRCAEIESECVELALGIARRLFCAESQENETLIRSVIREAMEHLGTAENITLILNPLDQKRAEDFRDFWAPLSGSALEIRVLADSRVTPGGCILESASGTRVELTTEQILARVEEIVRSRYAQLRKNRLDT